MKRIYTLGSVIIISIALSLSTSCSKKDIVNEISRPESLSKVDIGIQGVVSPSFDWENVDFMPMPSAAGFEVPVPWGSGASRSFSEDILNDYRAENGWVLLYNTFNTQTMPSHLYFILYNKYRGLIRMYWFSKPEDYEPSTNIVHSLLTEGNYADASPIMNYAVQPDYVDFEIQSKLASMLENQQVHPRTWYAFQYELAYDANLSNQNYSSFRFSWPIRGNLIQEFSINGTVQGSVQNGALMPNVNLTMTPNAGTSGYIPIYGPTTGGTSPGGSSIWNKIVDTVLGVVKDFLKGIFGGSDSNQSSYYLLNADVNLEGSLVTSFGMGSLGLAVPGYNQSSTPTYTPIYNHPLGVFYITQKPTVNIIENIYLQYDESGHQIPSRVVYNFNTDMSSFDIDYNPQVEAEATIADERIDIIVNGGGNLLSGTEESIGRTGTSLAIEEFMGQLQGIRISFDVIPNNGSSKVKIVKSFRANFNITTITHGGGEQPN